MTKLTGIDSPDHPRSSAARSAERATQRLPRFLHPQTEPDATRHANPRHGSARLSATTASAFHTRSRLKIKEDDDGYHQIRIFQDTNKNGKASRKELIYAGSIKLSKTIHRCDWQLQNNPWDVAGCTMEYIPTTFACQLISNEGDSYRLDGIDDQQQHATRLTGVVIQH